MVDLEMAEHPLDAVALTVKPLVVAVVLVGLRWDDGAIIGLVGDEGVWHPLRQLDQGVVAVAAEP
jgi:hypothetical protein